MEGIGRADGWKGRGHACKTDTRRLGLSQCCVQPWKVICLHSASVSHLLMGRSDSSPPRKAQIVIICTLLNADPDT